MHLFQSCLAVLLLINAPYVLANSWSFEDATVQLQSKSTDSGVKLNKDKLDPSKALPTPVTLGATDSFRVALTPIEDKRPKRPHQAFFALTDPSSGLEETFPVGFKDSAQGSLNIAQKDISPQLIGSNTPLRASFILGSFGSSKPSKTHVFDLTFTRDSSTPLDVPPAPLRYGKLPEIHHIFKADPKSPPAFITAVFSCIVFVTLPVLLGVWMELGMNLFHISEAFSTAPVAHGLFVGSIFALEFIFFLYYLRWNLFQTLPPVAIVIAAANISTSKVLKAFDTMSSQFQDFDDAESDTGDFNPSAEGLGRDEREDVKEDRGSPRSETSDAPINQGNGARQRISDRDDMKPGRHRQTSPGSENGDLERSPVTGAVGDDAGEDDEGPGEDITNNADDDEEDEEDEEDEDEDAGPTRKRRKRTRNQFIDVEAEVDDEDEEQEDEDEEEREEFVADTHPDDEGLDAAAERDDRRHRELDMQRQRDVEIDAEKEAERFRKKYGRNQAAALNSAVTPQSYLVPSVDDPSIWSVKCKLGKEKEVVYALMKRIVDRMGTREQLEICSAFERSNIIPGHFYVEAFRSSAVMSATDNLAGAYPKGGLMMVPIGEMPDLLRVRKTESVEIGKYIRVKRGKYAGDLAQVNDVMENGLEVELKLVPRLEYGAVEDSDPHKRKRPGGSSKNAISGRPPPRLFSATEAQKRMGKYLQQGNSFATDSFNFMGEVYVNGFLIKTFKIQHLETENVDPRLEEVSPFQEAGEGSGVFDLQALQTARKQQKSTYLVGDKVEVWQGEQQGAAGSVISTQGDIVALRISEGSLKGQTIEAPTAILRKYFQVGNHVSIIGGNYAGATGFVERIKDERVSIVTDSTQEELTVFSKDLREADEAVGMVTAAQSKGYDVHDLVRMDNATVGVVIKTDRDSLRILDQYGNIQNKSRSGIQQKIDRKKFDVSLDRDGAEVRLDDSVKEVVGAQRQGIVMHMNRGFLFMRDRSRVENAGMFVARNSNVVSMAAQRSATNGSQNGIARPNGNTPMPPPRSFGRDRYLGKTCRIRRGPYKALIGLVKDATETDVRLELQGKQKIINIQKDLLVVVDPETNETIQMPQFGGPRPAPTFAHRPAMEGPAHNVPSWDGNGGRTPVMNGGRTPGWAGGDGGRTPAWAGAAAGNKTPAWRQASRPTVPSRNDGSRTAYGGGDGSRTSYGGATAYGGVSAWNPNTSTPYHASSSFSGSRTPAAGAYGSAATPGGYSADTPGANLGYGANYATPGPTPGAYAQTPGASGMADDGYED
ncbi:MAG: hypothetical protein Q9162_000296 [Coniocarpon cinnabarinum]